DLGAITGADGQVTEDFVSIQSRKDLSFFDPAELDRLVKGDAVYKTFVEAKRRNSTRRGNVLNVQDFRPVCKKMSRLPRCATSAMDSKVLFSSVSVFTISLPRKIHNKGAHPAHVRIGRFLPAVFHIK